MTATSSPLWPTSALRAAAAAFAALTCEPAPMSLDCRALAETEGVRLPPGVVPLPALQAWLMQPGTAAAAQDVVWRELVRRARIQGPDWVVAAAGMAMPALNGIACRLAPRFRGDRDDLDAEILAGFLAGVHRVDRDAPGVFGALVSAATDAGHRLIGTVAYETPVVDEEAPLQCGVAGPRAPRLPYEHEDLLVQRAVSLGLVDGRDAQSWIAVRLGRRDPDVIAARLGVGRDALRMRLTRTDRRLADALRSGVLDDGVVSPAEQARIQQDAHRRHRAHATVTALHSPRPAAPATAAVLVDAA
ncbi:hypothetical protein AB0368_06795 [Actinoplanes sp. NPDC051475]|uniref:hypothetical protein n=1 Tax=Actinoplanes sp. NPDC051475 TaxID=3157225 RepID=UPI00344CD2D3